MGGWDNQISDWIGEKRAKPTYLMFGDCYGEYEEIFERLELLASSVAFINCSWNCTYGSEGWTLNLDITNRFASSERKTLRTIFVATEIGNICEKRYNSY